MLFSAENAPACLVAREASVRYLGGGISNAASPASRIVCKQALEKIRVQADGHSRPNRTLPEADATLALAQEDVPGAIRPVSSTLHSG